MQAQSSGVGASAGCHCHPPFALCSPPGCGPPSVAPEGHPLHLCHKGVRPVREGPVPSLPPLLPLVTGCTKGCPRLGAIRGAQAGYRLSQPPQRPTAPQLKRHCTGSQQPLHLHSRCGCLWPASPLLAAASSGRAATCSLLLRHARGWHDCPSQSHHGRQEELGALCRPLRRADISCDPGATWHAELAGPPLPRSAGHAGKKREMLLALETWCTLACHVQGLAGAGC